MLRILVVGAGGREHALVWKLSQAPAAVQLFAAPGNPGIAQYAHCLPINVTDIATLAAAAQGLGIDLTVVGPEAPLAAGIVDVFSARGLRIFGPTQTAAQIEASKVFAKQLMRRSGIPTPAFEVFTDPVEALTYVRSQGRPLAIKADGLAAGKGVVVAETGEQAVHAITDLMVAKVFGNAGDRIVVEERLDGTEVSVLALVGRGGVVPLVAAQDYKRAYDGGRGPNTGGMGAIAPAMLPARIVDRIVSEILEPAVAAMAREGRAYTGILYAGVMVTNDGPQVLEFNCRFGDPEAQVILPLLESDLAAAIVDTLEGRQPKVASRNSAAVCIVLASGGYPGSHQAGFPIAGLDAMPDDVLVFHAGTARRDEAIVTAGGRVLNVVGLGPTLEDAAGNAYGAVGGIHFGGMHYRTDIGRVLVSDRISEMVSVAGGVA